MHAHDQSSAGRTDSRPGRAPRTGGVVPTEGLAEQKLRRRRLDDDLAMAALVGHDVIGVGLQVAPATAGVLEQLRWRWSRKRMLTGSQ